MVSVPIGNLGDLGRRGEEILSRVQTVLVEDTREAGLLFSRMGLDKKEFISLFEHNEKNRINAVLELLQQGREIALICTAGTPVVSDPGYLVVRVCRNRGYKVVPVPGPNAPVTALMASGLPPQPFTFLGFLPRKSGEKRRTLLQYARLRTTLILFERKNRLQETLEVAYQVLGNRECRLARELTKRHEEILGFDLAEFKNRELDLPGEFTVLFGPPQKQESTPQSQVVHLLKNEMAKGGKPKGIIHRVLDKLQGWNTKQVYELYLSLKNKEDLGREV